MRFFGQAGLQAAPDMRAGGMLFFGGGLLPDERPVLDRPLSVFFLANRLDRKKAGREANLA
jgi:hypothetical protein